MLLHLLVLALVPYSSASVDTCSGPLVRITSQDIAWPMLAAQSQLGAPLNTSISGSLHAASPLDACGPLDHEQSLDSIILVVRGNCSFVTKANYVNESGAKAMLLMDDLDGCIMMGADDNVTTDNLRVYSLSISHRSGLELISPLNSPSGSPIDVVLEPMETTGIDPSLTLSAFILLLIATGSLVIGAVWSGNDY